MEPNIAEVAERIKAMREMCDISVEEMAGIVGKTPEEYVQYESGNLDFSFTFLHKCAEKFGIDIVELLTGENPHLSGCTLVRKGRGLPIKRRIGFEYEHLAFNFKDLNGSVTKSIGAQTYEFPTRSTLKDEVMDDIAYCAEAAMNTLMNSEGMAEKLNSLAMSIKNAADMPKGPLKLIVNASVFDAKIRKKAMYMLKKEIVARKLAPASKVRSTNTSLTAVIENPEITETDVLYMEHIMPILESIGVEISDDKVHYAADTLTLNP